MGKYSLLIKAAIITLGLLGAFWFGQHYATTKEQLSCVKQVAQIQQEVKQLELVIRNQQQEILGMRNATVLADKLREQAEKLLAEKKAENKALVKKAQDIKSTSCEDMVKALQKLEGA